MIEAPPYPDEERRLSSLKQLHLLDTPIEERFERITRMVCKLLDVPISLFNLIDADRQHYKSARGINDTDAPLDAAFCTHALNESEMLFVPDTSLDDRFHDNPFVTGERLNIGFYAGCPVRTPDGMPVGTLCAIDTKPRKMTDEQLTILRDLAAMVETELRAASLSKAQKNLIEELNTAQLNAMVDPLTRLWNLRGIKNLLEREWHEALRQKKPFTVVMSDIDHFKKINDTYGHPGGDAVLREVSKKLLQALRTEDAVGRVGGEEFLVFLNDCTQDKILETVERLRQTVTNEAVRIGLENYPVTMSFGVTSVVPNSDMSMQDIINAADHALYEAKNSGRNCVRVAA